MALADFHPAVANWFARTFAAPTEAQAAAWPARIAGQAAACASVGAAKVRANQLATAGWKSARAMATILARGRRGRWRGSECPRARLVSTSGRVGRSQE